MTESAITEQPPFDLANDPIPSFGALQQERARIFSGRSEFEHFQRSVEALPESGEQGRRKGLGAWAVGDFERAVELLRSHEQDDVATFTRANALMSLGRPEQAGPLFERLSRSYPDEPRPRGGWLEALLEAQLAQGSDDQAREALETALTEAPAAFADSAEGHYLRGRCADLRREVEVALDEYDAARDVDPTHRGTLFRLAYLAERSGLDELGLECYETLARLLPADRNVLMNLGMLYEDLGRDQDAAACYDTVVKNHPTDRRARLFLADALAGMNMYYDEDRERKEDILNKVLQIPVTDFELSVRSRNSLAKMEVHTLGDLTQKTEAELLSFKNFGETSLSEIKEILASKGLRLGMKREEAAASVTRTRVHTAPIDESDPRNRPVSVLRLSIRARRTVENLGCMTLGEVTEHAEDQLLAMPNFGATSLIELKSKLAEHGLALKSRG